MPENVNVISGKVGLDTTDFKANISALNQNIKLAQAEFAATAASLDKWDESQAGLLARMESLTKVTEAQREKVGNLREIYKQVAAEKGENSKAAQDLEIRILKEQAALNGNEKELRQTSAALDSFGKETASAGDKASKFGEHLENIKGKLKDLGGDIAKAAVAGVAAVGAAVAGAAAGAFKMAQAAGEQADALLVLEAKTGIGVEALQKMEYAARFVDVELETMTGSMTKMIKSMDAAKEGASAFDVLGVAVRDSSGQLRDQQTVWAETIGALGKVGNETERNALAMKIFGKSAMELNPLIKAGGDELKRFGEEAQSLGLVLSSDVVNQAGKFDDMLQKLQATSKSLAANIGVAVMPAFESIVGAANSIIPKIIEAVKTGNWDEAGAALQEGLGDLVQKAVKALPGLAEAAGKIITTLVQVLAEAIPDVLPELVKVAVQIVKSLVDTLIENAPQIVKAVVDGVRDIAKGLLEVLPKILELGLVIITELAKGIGEALPVLVPAIIQTVSSIVQTLVDSIPMLIDGALALMLGFVDAIIASIPAIVEAIVKAIPQILQAGIKLLMALVDAIPEVVIALVAALPQIITGIVKGLMEALPQIVQAGIDLFVALIQKLPDIIKQIVMIIPSIITAVVGALADSVPEIIKAGVQLFVALVKALPTIIIEIVKAVPAIIKAVIQGFAEGFNQMVQAGKDLIGGVWKGISDSATWLWDQVKGFFGGLIDKIKGLLGIHSPSDVMAELVGKPMGLGIAEGFATGLEAGGLKIESALSGAMSKIQSQIAQATKAAEEARRQLSQAYSSDGWEPIGENGTKVKSLGFGPADEAAPANTNINYTFNSPKALSAREMQQIMTMYEQLVAARQGL